MSQFGAAEPRTQRTRGVSGRGTAYSASTLRARSRGKHPYRLEVSISFRSAAATWAALACARRRPGRSRWPGRRAAARSAPRRRRARRRDDLGPDLHNHRINHRQVQAGRHAVVQEAGVGHDALAVVDVLLVQGPADALDGAALHLALDVGGVNGGAAVLHGRVAQDRDLARVGVHRDIHDVGGEGPALAGRIDAGPADDRAARLVQLGGQFLERETLGRVGPAGHAPVS